MGLSLLCFSLLFIILCTADGYEHYTSSRCLFNSTELRGMEYIRSYYYNSLEYARFDSSVGKFVGYTEYGVKYAEMWNNDQGQLAFMRAQKEKNCKPNIDLWYQSVLTKSVKPSASLHSMMPSGNHHPALLVCSVYDFYPKQIKVSWRRNGQEVTSDITTTEEMANSNWLYQIHSHLEYTPRSGEKIFCVVEHSSLEKPVITDWVPSMSESKKLMIVGAFGLSLGLVFFLAGVIYMKMSQAQSLKKPQKEMFYKLDSELYTIVSYTSDY
uniref:Ig-like domain-containing protein n=1 Tax=Oreochromis aureus TaxID=47969 RepID=A0A668URS8_OREAU